MNDSELAHQIEAYLRGTLAQDALAGLEERMRRDPAARREFYRAANLESALRDWAARSSTLEPWLDSAAPAPRAIRFVHAGWWAAAAAAVICVAALTWSFRSPENSPTAPLASVERTAQGCAVLTQAAGTEWQGTMGAARLGDILNTGRVTLKQGLAQIEFFSGAKLVVEGPAEFHIVSPWEVTWEHGKARVHVPPAARGFRLLTPGMKLVDLGTEFGVEVNRSTQDTRVAVFAGEVMAHPNSGQQLNLREGEGIAQTGNRFERMPAGRADDFVSGNSLERLSQRHAQNRFTAWAESSRVHARDPRLIAYYPLHEVDSWSRIVRNAASSSDRDLDGGAVGVSITAGRWAGKPALQFRRPGDRVRLQIEGTYDAITLACWVKVDSLDRTYNALFLTDGYDAGEPHWQIYEDGRLMFSLSYVNTADRKNNQIYFSPVVFDTVSTGRWHHIAVSYENERGEVVHYMDGRELSREISPLHVPGRPVVIGSSELGNWGLPTQNHRFPIRNLNGSLDEFALYRTALPPAEIRQLYENGKPE